MTDFDPADHEPVYADSVELTITIEKYNVDDGVRYVATTDLSRFYGAGDSSKAALESMFAATKTDMKYAAAFNDES